MEQYKNKHFHSSSSSRSRSRNNNRHLVSSTAELRTSFRKIGVPYAVCTAHANCVPTMPTHTAASVAHSRHVSSTSVDITATPLPPPLLLLWLMMLCVTTLPVVVVAVESGGVCAVVLGIGDGVLLLASLFTGGAYGGRLVGWLLLVAATATDCSCSLHVLRCGRCSSSSPFCSCSCLCSSSFLCFFSRQLLSKTHLLARKRRGEH